MRTALIILAAFILSITAVFTQVRNLGAFYAENIDFTKPGNPLLQYKAIPSWHMRHAAYGLHLIETGQSMKRRLEFLDGKAGNPWQYRMLSEVLFLKTWQVARLAEIAHAAAASLIFWRLIQNAAILLLAFGFYRRLGFSENACLWAMAVIVWMLAQSVYDSDLQLSTFFDVMFYLLAAWLTLARRAGWLIAVVAVAAFNRETSALMALFPLLTEFPPRRKQYLIAAAAAAVFMLIFICVRLVYGPQAMILPYGLHAGFEMLRYNLTEPVSCLQLMATYSLIPAIAILGWQRAPNIIRRLSWLLLPLWLCIHAFMGIFEETRLFLVPALVVGIPLALAALSPHSVLHTELSKKQA